MTFRPRIRPARHQLASRSKEVRPAVIGASQPPIPPGGTDLPFRPVRHRLETETTSRSPAHSAGGGAEPVGSIWNGEHGTALRKQIL